MALSQRDDLLGVDLEQARRGDRPDREYVPWARRSPAGCPSRRPPERRRPRRRPGRSAPIPRTRRRTTRSPSVWGKRTTSIGSNSVGRRRDRAIAEHQVGDQPIELVEIDRGDLTPPACARDLIVQLVPPLQEVALSVTFQSVDQRPDRADISTRNSCATERRAPHADATYHRSSPDQNSTTQPIVGQDHCRRQTGLRRSMIEAVRQMRQESAPGLQASMTASASLSEK